jgi:hypothetical protein
VSQERSEKIEAPEKRALKATCRLSIEAHEWELNIGDNFRYINLSGRGHDLLAKISSLGDGCKEVVKADVFFDRLPLYAAAKLPKL